VILAGTLHGVFISRDFGTTWKPLSDGHPQIPTAVAVAPSQKSATVHIFGQGIGLQRSTDGGRVWMHEDVNLGGSSVTTIVTDRKGEKAYASVGTAVYYRKAGSDAWVTATDKLVGGRITSIAFSADSVSVLYASTTRGMFRSANAGETWTQFGRRLRFPDVRFFDTHPVISSRFFASSEHGFVISTDKGATWTDSRPVTQKFKVRALTFSPTNAGLLHAAMYERGIITSTDGGFTWEHTRYGITSDSIIAVTHHPGDSKTLFVWTSTGDGFRSLDNGVSWNRYAPPWNIGDKVHVAFDRYQPTNVVALVNNQQIYYSRTGGATWLPVTTGDLRAEVLAAHWNGTTATLFAGTKNAGVFRLGLRELLKEMENN